MSYVFNKFAGALRYTGEPTTTRPSSWRDINIRPVSEAWRTPAFNERQPAYRSAVANAAYIWRDSDAVDETGAMPRNFAERRFELISSGLLLPASAPLWATRGYQIWEEADRAARRSGDPTEVRAWHVIMALPGILRPFWTDIVTSFADRELVSKGAAVAYAIHACEAGDGGWLVKPHCHLVVTARHWRHDSRLGERHPAWIANRAQQQRMCTHWRDLMAYLAFAA